jgi:hypothetical protein
MAAATEMLGQLGGYRECRVGSYCSGDVSIVISFKVRCNTVSFGLQDVVFG